MLVLQARERCPYRAAVTLAMELPQYGLDMTVVVPTADPPAPERFHASFYAFNVHAGNRSGSVTTQRRLDPSSVAAVAAVAAVKGTEETEGAHSKIVSPGGAGDGVTAGERSSAADTIRKLFEAHPELLTPWLWAASPAMGAGLAGGLEDGSGCEVGWRL